MSKYLYNLLIIWLAAGLGLPLLAQDYGTGVVLDVPYVAPGTLTMDGVADEAFWETAPTLSMEEGDFDWSGGWNNDYGADPDIGFTVKMAYTADTLYVYALFEDYQDFYFGPEGGSGGGGDQILVAIDAVHQAGVTDTLIDDSWSGWPENAPDKGPTTYKIAHPDWGGITSDWAASAVDSGWVNGQVLVDDVAYTFAVEMAIYADQIAPGSQIGFNVGGATGHPDESFEYEEGARDYAWFSWQTAEYTGGDLMRTAASLSTLNLVPAPYGTGLVVDVPYVAPGALTMDGVADEAFWETAPTLSMEEGDFDWSGGWNNDYGADPDIGFTVKMAYTADTLYVYALFEDYQEFYFGPEGGSAGGGDQILVAIDAVHQAGVTDVLIDDSWSGWPENAPDKGPTTYKIAHPDWGGITSDWAASAVDSGWVNGQVIVDDVAYTFAVEMAIYADQIAAGSQIGFNVGGATGHPDPAFEYEEGARDYAWFSWQTAEYTGGDLMRTAASLSTLNLVAPAYGTGIEVEVPMVSADMMTLDGVADEPVWADAPTLSMEEGDFDWSGGWNNDYGADPDIGFTAKMLYSPGSLYVYALFEDYQDFYWGPPGSPGGGDQILVAIDAVHQAGVTDVLIDDSWSGWPENAPDKGPTTFKIAHPDWGGITVDWAASAVDSGWVDGTVLVDDVAYTFSVEMAIHADQIQQDGEIGFNIGGATGHPDESFEYEEGARDYAWFSWQTAEYTGGDLMRTAASFSTLKLVDMVSTAIDEDRLDVLPERFALRQNYPNPFNPATNIEYMLAENGHVRLVVYNPLGQRVATLVDDFRPNGTYRVRWDAAELPSGPYLYQLAVDDEIVASKMMVLIK